MKPSSSNSNEEPQKTTQSKSTKKSTKSRSKNSKNDTASTGASGSAKTSSGASSSASGAGTNQNHTAVTPSTPLTVQSANFFDATTAASSSPSIGTSSAEAGTSSRNHHKSYFGLEPRSIKIIWEQHDQSDVELSADVCARLAEDASYKLWELINNVKVYARHSGGVVTYDLVNEVLRDADVPPALGAMDSDWDRIDYDGSFYFYSDKIIELRDEYQKEVTISMPDEPDFSCSWPVDDQNAEAVKEYLPLLMKAVLHGNTDALDEALFEAAFSPTIGTCYRAILNKIIEVLAFKQSDAINARCWRLLRACSINTCIRGLDCREEYFHLAELLICQLLAPYESIKVHAAPTMAKTEKAERPAETTIKTEIDDDVNMDPQLAIKTEEYTQENDSKQQLTEPEGFSSQLPQTEKVYKLLLDDNDDDGDVEEHQFSAYFGTAVDLKYVDELCSTIGHVAARCGYMENECLIGIHRRLERFFDGREMSSERDFNYVSRAVRGLIALGEYSFREFIPFVYQLKADNIPETHWTNFALAGMFLHGADDVFLYEWLAYLCGVDKLQPFLGYYAQHHEDLLTRRFHQRKCATYKIIPKLGVRRLEWNTLAAAMCHGDDPHQALKPKPTLHEVFPELVKPNLQMNRSGAIRFKFAGCRPVIIKPKTTTSSTAPGSSGMREAGVLDDAGQSDILIARRRLFKPLTNERRVVPLSAYNTLCI